MAAEDSHSIHFKADASRQRAGGFGVDEIG
jgi:hypothetical protein